MGADWVVSPRGKPAADSKSYFRGLQEIKLANTRDPNMARPLVSILPTPPNHLCTKGGNTTEQLCGQEQPEAELLLLGQRGEEGSSSGSQATEPSVNLSACSQPRGHRALSS